MNETSQPAGPSPVDPGTAPADAMERSLELQHRDQTEQRFRSGASWFYWVAGLSVVNSVISMFEGGWSFLFGLGVTQVVDSLALYLAEQTPDSATLLRGGALLVNLAIAALFALFGWLALRRKLWAIWVGGALYLADALLLLLVRDWLGLAFHGWVLFALFRGYQAGRELARLDAPDPFAAPPVET